MTDLVREAERAISEARREDWLTVKEFAAFARLSEHTVREAIRGGRLSYRVERVTTGKKGTIRIVVPRFAA